MTPIKNLKLGDTVKLFDGGYGSAMVTKITETELTFFRPYASCSDFSMEVIEYIGVEHIIYSLDSSREFELLDTRKPDIR